MKKRLFAILLTAFTLLMLGIGIFADSTNNPDFTFGSYEVLYFENDYHVKEDGFYCIMYFIQADVPQSGHIRYRRNNNIFSLYIESGYGVILYLRSTDRIIFDHILDSETDNWGSYLVYSVDIELDNSSYDEGYQAGHDKGYSEGVIYGESLGYGTGYKEGEIYGYGVGYSEGQRNGYNSGFSEGQNLGEALGEGMEGFMNGLADFVSVFLTLGVGSLTLGSMLGIVLIAFSVMLIVKIIRG